MPGREGKVTQSYWSNLMHRRLSKRRAMLGTGATVAGAAFLIACGSGNDDASSTDSTGTTGGTNTGSTGATGTTGAGTSTGSATGTSGLVTKIADTSAEARPGGRFVIPTRREPLHFDGKAQGQVQLNTFNGVVYEALVRNKPGEPGSPSAWTEVLPELAESWEISPDKTEVVFKLRQNAKWQNKPPINGRPFVAEDVAATWNKYENASTPNNRFTNSNNLNPAAPIISFTPMDEHTVVLKLAEPATYIFQRLASMTTGEVGSIYPMEAGESFDAKLDQIGTGGWMLDHFTPSVELLYKKNPEYWGKENSGFFDEIHYPVIGEYASRLAQFKTGALSHEAVSPEDLVPTKQEVPDLNMFAFTPATNSTGFAMRFGWLPIAGQPSPFLDIRVRQALTMAEDRNAHINAFYNVDSFSQAGLPIETYWYTTQGYVPEWTLDPRNAEKFGENAKYFPETANMEEAKKLFDAAQSAYPGGHFPEIVSHAVQTVFGPVYTQETETMDNYARSLGFTVTTDPLDYNLDYLTSYITEQGQFEGILYGIGAVTSPDMVDYYLWRFYSKTGATSGQLGFGGPDGSLGDMSGDPEVDAMIEKAKGEFDLDARISVVHDLQRYLAYQQYAVMRPGFADDFVMAWPAIQNFATNQGDSRCNPGTGVPFGMPEMWFDESRPHG